MLRGTLWAVEGSGCLGWDLPLLGWEGCQWVYPVEAGGGGWASHRAKALTLQLGALVALALAPGSADASTAVFLLGEAREGIAATLERGVWAGVIGCPAPTWPPS